MENRSHLVFFLAFQASPNSVHNNDKQRRDTKNNNSNTLPTTPPVGLPHPEAQQNNVRTRRPLRRPPPISPPPHQSRDGLDAERLGRRARVVLGSEASRRPSLSAVLRSSHVGVWGVWMLVDGSGQPLLAPHAHSHVPRDFVRDHGKEGGVSTARVESVRLHAELLRSVRHWNGVDVGPVHSESQTRVLHVAGGVLEDLGARHARRVPHARASAKRDDGGFQPRVER